MYDPTLHSTCIHESAHLIIADIHNVKFTEARILSINEGWVEYNDKSKSESKIELAQIYLAGMQAELIFLNINSTSITDINNYNSLKLFKKDKDYIIELLNKNLKRNKSKIYKVAKHLYKYRNINYNTYKSIF